MICGNVRRWRQSLLVVGVALLAPRTSHAFKLQSHEAVAIEAANQIQAAFGPGGTDKLSFKVNGTTLDVPLQIRDVANAINDQPSFFLGGALGPDAFPDPVSGQWIAHENGTPGMDSLTSQITGRTLTNPPIMTPFEQRHSVFKYRAIDFAMDMIQFFNNDYSKRAAVIMDTVEKEKVLAFLAGYLSHGVTDSFAHTWVNETVGDSWDLFKGSGMFGTLTEEVRHVAVESLVDHRAPKTPFQTPGDGGGFGKLNLTAPIAFLDAFYSSPTALGAELNYNISSDPVQFFKYFRNIDLFRGGVVTLYLNAQIEIAPALRSWSRMSRLFDIADAVNDNTLVQLFFSLTDIPINVLNDLITYAPDGINDLTKLATFGYVSCLPARTIDVYGQGIHFTDALKDALNFLGGMNERIAAQTERARVARRNMLRLSECIGESFTKLEAAQFNPATPTLKTDPCADIVRAGYQDEGNPNGLDRGNIRSFKLLGQDFISPLDAEFLMDLKGSFIGDNPDKIYAGIPNSWKGDAPFLTDRIYETTSLHRSALKNFERVLTYLRFPGNTLATLGDAILPPGGSSPTIVQKFNAICGDARDSTFQNCLDGATLGIATAARELKCADDWAVCAGPAIVDCAQSACDAACDDLLPCGTICGKSDKSSCVSFCHGTFLYECDPIFGICGYLVPLGYACGLACGAFDTTKSCVNDTAVVEKCGEKAAVCSYKNVVQTVELHGLGGAILSPIRKACDTVDAAKAFFDCLKGDPSKTLDQQKTDRHNCIVNACQEVMSVASNLPPELQNFDCEGTFTKVETAYEEVTETAQAWQGLMTAASKNPEQFVNVAFFQDDIKKDTGYRDTVLATVASKRTALAANPPPSTASPDDVQLFQDEVTVLDTITAVGKGGAMPPALTALRLGRAIEALTQQPWPNTLGPTVNKVVSDMGADFNNTFNQAFNAIQATKLTPMMSQTDINALMSQAAPQGATSSLLPWNSPSDYSAVCSQSMTSLYCDVLKSFDDPNCHGPECQTGRPGDTGNDLIPGEHNWVPGRGLVAFNTFDATNPTGNVLTNFPLAATQANYDNLYRKVFQVRRPRPTPTNVLASVDAAKAQGFINNAGLATNIHNELATAMSQAASGNLVGEDGTLNTVLNQLIDAREEQCAPTAATPPPACRQIDDATAARLIVNVAELVATDSFTDADYRADPPTLKVMEAMDQAFGSGKLSVEIYEISVHDAAAAVVSEHSENLPAASQHLVDTVEDLLASLLRTCSPNPSYQSCPLADKPTARALIGQFAELAATIALPAAGLPAAQPVRNLLVELDGDFAGGLVSATLYDSLRKNLHDAAAAAAANQKANEKNILKAMQTTLEAALAHPCTTQPLDNCSNFDATAGN